MTAVDAEDTHLYDGYNCYAYSQTADSPTGRFYINTWRAIPTIHPHIKMPLGRFRNFVGAIGRWIGCEALLLANGGRTVYII